MCKYQIHFFCSPHLHVLLGRPRVVSRASGWARRSSARTGACLGPDRVPCRMLWAFKVVQTGYFQGIGFRDDEPRRTMETPQFHLIYLCCCCITPSLELSSSLLLWQPRFNSSRTQTSSFCDGHGPRFCVRARVRTSCFMSSYEKGTNIISTAGQTIGRSSTRLQRTHIYFSRNSKPTAQLRCTLQRQQRYNSSTTAAEHRHLRLNPWYLRQPRCFCVRVCAVFTRTC